MAEKNGQFAALPKEYDTYIFDLYGTLVDIKTDESDPLLWQRLALFYGYYDAQYSAEEIKAKYLSLVNGKESALKKQLSADKNYDSHEASPEIELLEVFSELFEEKEVKPSTELALHAGQLFRVMSTEHLKLYPGTAMMLEQLRNQGKKVYLLSNAQRIFTEYELHMLGIAKYFDGILISSDYHTRKPDKRFFDALLTKYDINIRSAIFVGNDSRSDIGGAKQVNLDTYYVKSNISPQGDWAEDATYKVDNFIGWKVE